MSTGIGMIHLAGEHALEFEFLDLGDDGGNVGLDALDDILVAFRLAQFQHLAGIAQALRQRGDAVDHPFQLRAFLAQLLGMRRVVPDIRILQLATDFLQALGAGVEVKDTPGANAGARSGRRCWHGWDWSRSRDCCSARWAAKHSK
jgi:hypothetical protein